MSSARPRLRGRSRLPGDKSIAHRALVIAALASEPSVVRGVPPGRDVASTRRCLELLGTRFEVGSGGALTVLPGAPWRSGLTLPAGNSGTTARLLAGALVATGTAARIVGDASLSRRPMGRVTAPLRELGARPRLHGDNLPLEVEPAPLRPAAWTSRVPSAQVKTAFLIGALGAGGVSRHVEPVLTRDHAERLLPSFGVAVTRDEGPDGFRVAVVGGRPPGGAVIEIPGDASSAAVLATAAALLPGSDVTLQGVSLNPTRCGALEVLRRMGALVAVEVTSPAGAPEPSGDVRVRPAPLRGSVVAADEVPRLVDELPLLVLAAAAARGESRFEGLSELRLKESDRLVGVLDVLVGLGVAHALEGDRLVVRGGAAPRRCRLDPAGDHRLAMLHAVAALAFPGLETDRSECVAVSWPGFYDRLDALVR